MSRVEFARKLGYAEPLVHIALARLDINPSQNELLEELIKLDHSVNASNYNTKNKCSSLDSQCEQPIFPEMPLKSAIANPTFEFGSTFPLRPIVIDGSNVAISHGNKEVFSCLGIMLCVDWFKKRGHNDITVFVPKWRKENFSFDNPIKDKEILNELERDRMLVFTPSRLIGGKRMVCYDDRYILKLAVENDGVVVSNDNYRDLMQESSEFKKVIEERILMFSFVNDRFMPPDDPLGRSGPTLDNFLRIHPRKINISMPCPYGKKCTYGNKCKFHHAERDSGLPKSIAQRTAGNAAFQPLPCDFKLQSIQFPKLARKSMSVPLNASIELSRDEIVNLSKKALCRTKSEVEKNSSAYVPLSFQRSHNTTSRKNLSQCTPFYNVMKHESSHENVQIVGNDKHEKYVNGSFDKQNDHLKMPETTAECSAEPQNIHKKLRRQLTLNVIGESYSSRKLNVHKYHRPLASSYSEPRSQHSVLRNLHQNITRANSDPDAYRKIVLYSPPSSELVDLHLNEKQLTVEDKRRKLNYHLSNIFPANQVEAVMQIHPNETNPQKICAAIISMYPNI